MGANVSFNQYTKIIKRLKRLKDCKIINLKEHILIRSDKILEFINE